MHRSVRHLAGVLVKIVPCGLIATWLLASFAASQSIGPPAPHRALRKGLGELARDLDHVPDLIARDGALYLKRARGGLLRIVGSDDYDPLVVLPDRRVIKIGERAYMLEGRAAILDEAIDIAATIRAPANRGWIATADYDELLGTSLLIQHELHTRSDVLYPMRCAADYTLPESLARDWKELIDKVEKSDLSTTAKKSFLDQLRHAGESWFGSSDNEEGDDNETESDLLPVEAIRDFVLQGQLRALLGDDPLVRRIEVALRGAMQFQTDRAWRNDKRSFVHIDNALSTEAAIRILRDRDRCLVARPIVFEDDVPDCELVIELPSQAAPDDLDKALVARLYNEGVEVLRYEQGNALHITDRARWDSITKPESRDLIGRLPPHLPLVDVHNRVHALVTKFGVTKAPGVECTGQEWIQRTAAQLQDAWHLDLVRAWFFRYVYDSPDARYPSILGTREIYGDIHQTVDETIARALGGRMCGDCDDLAEVFQALHAAQGGLGHVLSVPGHAAYGFAEKKGRLWYAQALHTYDAVRFRARTLDDALVRLYGFFDPGRTIEAAQLPILLRFSGENQRSTWRLGSRIFENTDYAKTMIDVQRYWHLHAYATAAKTMQAQLVQGDASIPDRLEYAGLLERQGRWQQAADQHEAILRDFEDARGEVALRLIAARFEAGDAAAALSAVRDFRDGPLRRIVRTGSHLSDTIFGLTNILLHNRDVEGCIDVCFDMAENEVSAIRKGILSTGGWLQSRSFDADMWFDSPYHHEIRTCQRDWVELATELLDCVAATDPRWAGRRERWGNEIETYFEKIMPWDLDEAADLLDRQKLIGAYRMVTEREKIESRIDTVKAPEQAFALNGRYGRKPRKPLSECFDDDLRWLHVSLPWHLGRFQRRIGEAKKRLAKQVEDEALLSDLQRELARIETAWKHARRLFPAADRLRTSVESCRYRVALISGDAAAQRSILRRVRDDGDKFYIDGTIDALGATAPLLDSRRFSIALEAYADTLDYRPLWFEIVWSAQRAGASERALQAANFACSRHPKDALFSSERDALHEIVQASYSNK